MSRIGASRQRWPPICPAPAFILTAGNDVMCGEGEAYAHRPRRHGVAVQLRQHPIKSMGF
jgi:acetyl esterase/lipase